MALAVADCLLWSSTQINRADNRAVLAINYRGVGFAVAENINAFRHGFEQDAIRAALHLNGLDRCQALAVPHDYGTAAAKTVVGLWVNRSAPRPGVQNCASR